MASSYYFKLTIRGEGGDGGAPHASIGLIICAAEVIQAVQSIQTREVDAINPTFITFARASGSSSGSLRTYPMITSVFPVTQMSHSRARLTRENHIECIIEHPK